MSTKRKYIPEVDFIRGLAILGVLFVHSTSVPTVTLGGHSSAYPLYLMLNKFGKLGTPTFIFLSSLVLFYTYYHKSLTRERLQHFYTQRLSFIVLPYLVWSVAYYLMLLTNGFENWHQLPSFDWDRFLGRDLLYGKAYPHLYFVIISIQFYILFPLLLFALQSQKKLIKWIFLLGLTGQWAFFFYNHFIWKFEFKGSLFFTYLSYYTLGAFVGIYYEAVTKWLQEFRFRLGSNRIPFWPVVSIAWLASGFFHVYVFYQGYVYNEWWNSRWYELAWNLYTLVSVVMLYYIAVWITRHLPKICTKFFVQLGIASFGIYLIHPMILYFWRNNVGIPGEPLLYHLYIAAGWAVALFGSWLIVLLVQRYLPLSWVILGQAKGKKKAVEAQTLETPKKLRE